MLRKTILKSVFILLFVLVLPTKIANAKKSDRGYTAKKVSSLSEVAEELRSRRQYYLQKNNAGNIHFLPTRELYSLLLESEDIKRTNSDLYKNSTLDSLVTNGSGWDWAGKIFLTMDSRTWFFNHGHAGIASKIIDSTIETGASVGVIQRFHSNYRYWDEKRCRRKYHNIPGGVYGVVNASQNQYRLVADFAKDKVGATYGLAQNEGTTFYCSELIHKAWQQAGITLSYFDLLWGYFILPADIMLSPDTYLIQDWSTWNNPSYPSGKYCMSP